VANDLNLCQFIGNLGADPDIRYTTNGVAVANLSVASNREWKDKQTGEKQQQTEWVRAVAFDKLAEICAEYLVKGSKVYIAGRMQTRKYDDKEGITRYSTEVVLNQMQMLDTKGGGSNKAEQQAEQHKPQGATQRQYSDATGGRGYPQEHGPGSPQQETAGAGGFSDDLDDDIPFRSVPDWAI